jgi:hypothetical protein
VEVIGVIGGVAEGTNGCYAMMGKGWCLALSLGSCYDERKG